MKIDYFKSYESFSEFIDNYDKDFLNLKSEYPDIDEVDFINTILDNRIYILYYSFEIYDYEKPYDEYPILIDIDYITYCSFLTDYLIRNDIFKCFEDIKISLKEIFDIVAGKQNLTFKDFNNYINIIVDTNDYRGIGIFQYETFHFFKLNKFVEIKYNGINNYIYFNEKKYINAKISYSKILNYLVEREKKIKSGSTDLIYNNKINSIDWLGSELELTELIEALITSGKIKNIGSKKEIYSRFKTFFNQRDFNHSDKIRDIKNRVKDKTVFLTLLEQNLFNDLNNSSK